jgi:uncharacterized protein (TIGR03435 family)
MRLIRHVVLVSVLCAAATAQTPAFEVASVKRSGPASVRNFEGGPGTRDPGQITCTKASMNDLLAHAYGIEFFQISGPAWFSSETETYDLHAKVPAGTTKEQAKIMMQSLLAERFHLAVHHVSKDFPAYEIVVAKSGVKFKEATSGPIQAKEGFPELPAGRAAATTAHTVGHARLAAHLEPISVLISMVRYSAGQPIIDMTGLKGLYDFYLHFDPAPLSAEPREDAAPSLPVALEQQLGLKLESKKLPFDVIVIDHVEKVPTEN